MNNKYTLKSIGSILIKNIFLIVICGVLFGGLFGFIAKHRQTTTYIADRSIIISHDKAAGRTTNSQVLADQNMIPTYQDVIDNPMITSNARKYLSKDIKKEYSSDRIAHIVEANAKPNSLVINISARTDSAKASVEIVNAVSKSMKDKLPEIDKRAGNVQLLAKSTINSVDSITKPSFKKYVAVGSALGILIGMVIAFSVTTWKKLI